MLLSQVACQLYTLRDFCKTAADLATTAKKVKAIGYAAVQISGVGPIPEAEVKRICDGEGLVICATHENGKIIVEETAQVIDRLAKLGTPYTAYPYPHVELQTLDDIKVLAAQLDVAGARMRQAGQVLTYHNHALEFKKIAGKTILQHLYDLTDPANLQGEIDTYWVAAGGESPVEWVTRLHRRLPLLHLKDYGVGPTNNHGAIMEIGNGNLNWQAIIQAAEKSGTQWYIVEQDTCPGDPFDSVAQSFTYISRHVVEHI